MTWRRKFDVLSAVALISTAQLVVSRVMLNEGNGGDVQSF